MGNTNGKNNLSFHEIIGHLGKVSGRRSAINSILIALLVEETKNAQAIIKDEVPWRQNTSSQTEKTKHR